MTREEFASLKVGDLLICPSMPGHILKINTVRSGLTYSSYLATVIEAPKIGAHFAVGYDGWGVAVYESYERYIPEPIPEFIPRQPRFNLIDD